MSQSGIHKGDAYKTDDKLYNHCHNIIDEYRKESDICTDKMRVEYLRGCINGIAQVMHFNETQKYLEKTDGNMNWYNYRNDWVNLSMCFSIYLENYERIIFYTDNSQVQICYRNNEEKQTEFEKIKVLMGM